MYVHLVFKGHQICPKDSFVYGVQKKIEAFV